MTQTVTVHLTQSDSPVHRSFQTAGATDLVVMELKNDVDRYFAPQVDAPVRHKEIMSQILALSLLPDGWDGADAKRPSPRVLDRAKRAISHLCLADAAMAPQLAIAPDGELSLDWQLEDRAASLSFLHDGTVYGYAFGPMMDEPWRLTTSIISETQLANFAARVKALT